GRSHWPVEELVSADFAAHISRAKIAIPAVAGHTSRVADPRSVFRIGNRIAKEPLATLLLFPIVVGIVAALVIDGGVRVGQVATWCGADELGQLSVYPVLVALAHWIIILEIRVGLEFIKQVDRDGDKARQLARAVPSKQASNRVGKGPAGEGWFKCSARWAMRLSSHIASPCQTLWLGPALGLPPRRPAVLRPYGGGPPWATSADATLGS